MKRLALAVVLAGCRQLAGLHDLEEEGTSDAPLTNADLVPSNTVVADHATKTQPGITVNDVVVLDTDTGQISGSIVRAGGTGVVNGIDYQTAEFGGAPLGVFAMSSLTVAPSGVIQLRGSRSAVIVVEGAARIEGKIDGGGGCADPTMRACPGAGGGRGETAPADAMGCSPGGLGTTNIANGADTGGGGGGGGGNGAAGGGETVAANSYPGGIGAPRCMAPELEPLLGGAGGGGGGKGAAPAASGGGGGGAVQISAFGAITVAGTITMGGAGGEGGQRDPAGMNGGAGGGGGGGGSILLEAPEVTITGTLSANGGGGGGGATNTISAQPGSNGAVGLLPAAGGAGGGSTGPGGNGGARDVDAAVAPSTASTNSGGGGGGVGRIFIRTASAPVLANATLSPAPGVGPIRTR